MAKRFLLLLWCFFVLVGCRIGNNVIAVSTITPIPSLTSTVKPTATLTPTQTGTPMVSPEIMRYQCLEIADHRSDNHRLKGVIAYNDEVNLYAYLANEETGDFFFFPREEGDRLLQFEVSPDGKWIMYNHYSVRTKEDRLVIATTEGKEVWSQIVDFFVLWSWFDNERLIRLESLENGSHALQVLNPFTGEHVDLQVDFPNSDAFTIDAGGIPSYPSWNYSKGGYPVYDPTLTRVVYPGTAVEKNGEWPIVIWDVQAQQPVAQFVTKDYWGATPLWTPDGRQFIFAANLDPKETNDVSKEFFAVSRNGEIRQLTHFMDYYQAIDLRDNYTLSPDGKLLAFWIASQPSLYEGLQLAVLNIETGEVTNYCIKGDAFADNATQPSSPVWSPDSTQLLVISRIPEDTKVRRVVVVDVLHNYAARINSDMEPVGWMGAP